LKSIRGNRSDFADCSATARAGTEVACAIAAQQKINNLDPIAAKRSQAEVTSQAQRE
jgi:hypothetical protein